MSDEHKTGPVFTIIAYIVVIILFVISIPIALIAWPFVGGKYTTLWTDIVRGIIGARK